MKRVIVGKPFNTEAVVDFSTVKDISIGDLPEYLDLKTGDSLELSFIMGDDDIVYGLGENVRGMNKRGGIYDSFCTDDFDHTPDKRSLYAAHNFLLISGERSFGIFIDHPGKVTFDIGFSNREKLVINADKKDSNIYLIEGEDLHEIVQEFRSAIGRSYVPPKWAFGFQQCRWSYPDADSIRKIAKGFRESNIPCDTIYMDIDYMDNYKNFTIDESKFPNFPEFVIEMKEVGIRLIPIIDAGCKIEEGYDIYEEGVENNYYCVDKDGKPFVGAVWPGKVHFPDFLKPETREWFGQKYQWLIDQGIEGFWNDMNEPAIFYSENGLDKAISAIKAMEGENLDIYSFFSLKSTFDNISNSEEDYKSFYHDVDGELVNHYDVHNLYGYNMTRAAGETFKQEYPDKRILMFSRASSTGMHRYGGIWTGDNKSWWEHLELNIKMMPALNMNGFLYTGADIGGFGCDAESDLVLRWTQFAAFVPLMRNHSALGTRSQEPFAFDDRTTVEIKKAIKFRYALLPFIYSEYMKAALDNKMLFRPLAFDFSDDMSKRVEDQLLLGDSIMLAPIYKANETGRNVWLPEDMALWRVKDHKEVKLELFLKGWHYITVERGGIPLFIRKGKAIILGESGLTVEESSDQKLTVISYTDENFSYDYYSDDGISYSFENELYTREVLTQNSPQIEKIYNI